MSGYGINETLGIAFQNSYGGVLADPSSAIAHVDSMNWIEASNETLKLNIPPLMADGMRGILDEADSESGARTVDGDVSMQAKPEEVGALLSTIFTRSTVTSGGIYTHTFKPRAADWDAYAANQPVTIYKNMNVAGSAFLYYDLCGSNIEFTCANREFLGVKVGFVGGNFSQIASDAASLPTGRRWAWNVASLSIGGTAHTEFRSITITNDEQLEAKHTLNGQLYPGRIKRSGPRQVRISGTLIFDAQAEFQQFLSQSERELDITFTGPTEIQSGYYDLIRFQLPKMRYSDYPPQGDASAGEIEVSFEAHGKYSVDSATSMQVTLINTRAAY